jgi:hypothetical protein
VKKTPWFRGNVKPVREGVYERVPTDATSKFSYWNGSYWCVSDVSVDGAADEQQSDSIDQSARWRGLAEPPKKASRK